MRKNKIIIIISIINIISAFTIGIFSGCNIGNDDNEITINGITYSFFSYNDENYYYAHNVEDESIVSVKIKDYINGYPVKKISSFRNCTNLTNIIIPSTVTTLADSAFYGCSALEDIELPDSIIEIGKMAFWNCYELYSFRVPRGVTELSDYIVFDCANLHEIYIHKNVSKIGKSFFDVDAYQQHVVPRVYFEGTKEEWDKIELGNGNHHLSSITFNTYQ